MTAAQHDRNRVVFEARRDHRAERRLRIAEVALQLQIAEVRRAREQRCEGGIVIRRHPIQRLADRIGRVRRAVAPVIAPDPFVTLKAEQRDARPPLRVHLVADQMTDARIVRGGVAQADLRRFEAGRKLQAARSPGFGTRGRLR